MEFDKIVDMVAEYLSESLDMEKETITAETNIQEDLDIDSIDLVDLIMAIESEYSIEIPDEDFEDLKTVGDVAEYIRNHTDN